MSHIQHQANSSLVIKIVSMFKTVGVSILNIENNTQWVPRRCMFLQEKIQSPHKLYHFADLLKYCVEKTGLSKINALECFTYCYKQVEHFNKKLHSIGHIHGDISMENILYGTKISVKVSLKNSISNSTSGKTYTYELVNASNPRCYMIDFGTSKSKSILTINHSVDQKTKHGMIFPTFLVAHPFLFKFMAYPEG